MSFPVLEFATNKSGSPAASAESNPGATGTAPDPVGMADGCCDGDIVSPPGAMLTGEDVVGLAPPSPGEELLPSAGTGVGFSAPPPSPPVPDGVGVGNVGDLVVGPDVEVVAVGNFVVAVIAGVGPGDTVVVADDGALLLGL